MGKKGKPRDVHTSDEVMERLFSKKVVKKLKEIADLERKPKKPNRSQKKG
jgi:hypothetical protein